MFTATTPRYTDGMDAGHAVPNKPVSPRGDAPPPLPAWVGRRDVPRIPGTLRPSAYVARAYLHQKEHGGQPPEWAQKRAGGQWLFLRDYLEEDGRQNLAAIGISEAARVLGASRRAVQTWVDDGRIPTLQEARAMGESRRIDRAAFEQSLSELRARLTTTRSTHAPNGTTVAPTAPPPPDAELPQELTDDVAQRLAEAAAEREQLARERAEAERRLQALTREERKAAEREAKLKAGFAVRMDQARRDTREADRRRVAAAKETARTLAREQQALARERELRASLSQRLADWRRRSAARLASQLDDARASWRRKPPAPTPEKPQTPEDRRRSADAVAAQLRKAREAKLQETQLADEVDQIAARLAEEVASGERERYDAAIFFNDLMAKRNAPPELRIAAMKKHFPK